VGAIYGPPVPDQSAEEPAGTLWMTVGGQPGDGGTGGGSGRDTRQRSRRHRGLIITAVGVAVALAASTALALHAAQSAPQKKASGTSAVAARVDPGLVDVVSTLGYQDAMSVGTGLVLTPTGVVLTNNHVIDGATSVKVTDVGNGRTYSATVVGYDYHGDIAVLQLQKASGLRTVTLATAATVKVGEKVIALGNAGGKGGTPAIAAGQVTGLDESITAADEAEGSSEQLTGLISTNTALQPGDSGGPLVTYAGQVIGLDTAASTGYRFEQTATQGFAISIRDAASVAGQVVAGRSSITVHIGATGFLGVQAALFSVPFTTRTEVVVTGVLAGQPAATAGITAGDIILSIDGHAVSSPSDIQAVMLAHHPGDKVSVSWQNPAGQTSTATVILATGPAD
jgi:S1-C subfamily serine protease